MGIGHPDIILDHDLTSRPCGGCAQARVPEFQGRGPVHPRHEGTNDILVTLLQEVGYRPFNRLTRELRLELVQSTVKVDYQEVKTVAAIGVAGSHPKNDNAGDKVTVRCRHLLQEQLCTVFKFRYPLRSRGFQGNYHLPDTCPNIGKDLHREGYPDQPRVHHAAPQHHPIQLVIGDSGGFPLDPQVGVLPKWLLCPCKRRLEKGEIIFYPVVCSQGIIDQDGENKLAFTQFPVVNGSATRTSYKGSRYRNTLH